MCFGSSSPTAATTPAPAPAAPALTADNTPIGSARKAEDLSAFGSQTPTLRVDRSTTSGGVASGSGLTL